MLNPFFSYLKEEKTQYLTPTCSLNKAVLAKLPLLGIDDSIVGKCFRDIFSTELIVAEIKALSKVYGVDISAYDDYMLPKMLDKALLSEDIKYNQMASRVAVKFGDRLGMLLLALRLGEEENRRARPDWTDEHWDYWAQLDTVVFVGGLASSMLGRRFKERIQHIFDAASVKPYNIMLFDNGTYVASMGGALCLMENDTTSLVFDLGHTNIKRCIIKKGDARILEFTALESLRSRYVHSTPQANEDVWETALMLHKYLVKSIADTYRRYYERYDLSREIIISIANYNAGGVLNKERGGYAKLSELGQDYSKILSEDLSGALHKRVKVRLIHDGTANALYFSELENSVCISLGTSFGVGFTGITVR